MLSPIPTGVPFTGGGPSLHPNRLLAALLAGAIALDGCSAVREIPRAQLSDQPDQRDVVVDMRNGLHYEFDSARFGADSLWGYKRSEDEGDLAEVSTTPLALDDVSRVTVRRLDWYRTGLTMAGVLAGGIAVAVAQRKSLPSGSGDGGTIKPPPSLAHGTAR